MSTAGCLLTMLIMVAVIYFGSKIAEPYWRFYEYQGEMKQQVRFASRFTDDQIRQRLVQSADSLNLPPEASMLTIDRTVNHISISADYVETVELPLTVRHFSFSPHADADY